MSKPQRSKNKKLFCNLDTDDLKLEEDIDECIIEPPTLLAAAATARPKINEII